VGLPKPWVKSSRAGVIPIHHHLSFGTLGNAVANQLFGAVDFAIGIELVAIQVGDGNNLGLQQRGNAGQGGFFDLQNGMGKVELTQGAALLQYSSDKIPWLRFAPALLRKILTPSTWLTMASSMVWWWFCRWCP
jgi:hypothetical protein